MSSGQRTTAEGIEAATGLTVQTCKAIRRGTTSLVVEVNGEWVFRFTKGQPSRDHLAKRLRFLVAFAEVSPIAVPEPVYVTEDFVGYRKIAGAPLYPTQLERLRQGDRYRIARQLGLFLRALHHHEDASIDFDTGYLVMRHGYDRSCPEPFAKYLTAGERRRLDARLEAVADDPGNFVVPTRIIHGDLYFNNILWDQALHRPRRLQHEPQRPLPPRGPERVRGGRCPVRSGQGERDHRGAELAVVLRGQAGPERRREDCQAAQDDTEHVGGVPSHEAPLGRPTQHEAASPR